MGRTTQVTTKAVPERSPEGHRNPRVPVSPPPKSHPALGRVPRAACPRTGQGCGFLAPPTSEQSEGNHKKTSETPLKSQNPNSPTLTLFKAHCSFQVLQ